MKTTTKITVSTIAVFVVACIASESDYFVPNFEKWKSPRPMFEPLQRDLIKVEHIENESIPQSKEREIYSPNKVYFLVNETTSLNSIYVHHDKDYGLKIWFPRYQHRPIRPKWINAKLLYIEVFFNPHFGACWIYDVENEQVIYKERQNDGWQAYIQWHGYPENTQVEKKEVPNNGIERTR